MGATIWTYKKCYEEAKKYKCRKDFQYGRRGAYRAALKYGWLNEYKWMKKPQPKNKKWNHESCFSEAKKYSSLSEFWSNSPKAASLAKKNGWMKEYIWLEAKYKPNGYWTYERCYKEAKNYKSRSEFGRENATCYVVCLKNKWLDMFEWMPKRKRTPSKWNKELCFETARKYKTKVEFEREEKGCYLAAMRAGWLTEMNWFIPAVIEPMEVFKKSHCVYIYKDDALNVAYVGLTCDLKKRHNRHQKTGSVFKFFTDKNMKIPHPIILKDNLTPQESRYYENFFLEKYKRIGYTMLNKGRTGEYCGSFGGGRTIYTYEKSLEIAKGCKTLKEFYKKHASCYNRARAKGWINEYNWLKRQK